MSDAPIRLSKAAKEFNVGLPTVVEFLGKNGIVVEARPNTKIEPSAYQLLVEEFAPDRAKKQKSNELAHTKVVRETITLDDSKKTKDQPRYGAGRSIDQERWRYRRARTCVRSSCRKNGEEGRAKGERCWAYCSR